MSRVKLIRAAGTAAIVGGALRAGTSFAPDVVSEIELQTLYFVVDLFLLIGLLGFYQLRCEDTGVWGVSGFLLALVGLELVRSSRAVPGVDLYPGGALVFAGGLIILCSTAWKANTLRGWVPASLLLSMLVGLIGSLLGIPSLFVLSGVAFGIAFGGLGFETRSAARQLSGPNSTGHR